MRKIFLKFLLIHLICNYIYILTIRFQIYIFPHDVELNSVFAQIANILYWLELGVSVIFTSFLCCSDFKFLKSIKIILIYLVSLYAIEFIVQTIPCSFLAPRVYLEESLWKILWHIIYCIMFFLSKKILFKLDKVQNE